MSEPPSPSRPVALGVTVTVEDHQSDHVIEPDRWARLAEHALGARGINRGELTVTFVDQATIAELNREHMGAEGPTDVLSFPLDADLVDAADLVDTGLAVNGDNEEDAGEMPLILGDIVICPAVAAETAPRRLGIEPHPGFPGHDGSLDHELALLVVHGVLHVLGMDHAEPAEAAAMHQAEAQILRSFPLNAEGGSVDPQNSIVKPQSAPDKELLR